MAIFLFNIESKLVACVKCYIVSALKYSIVNCLNCRAHSERQMDWHRSGETARPWLSTSLDVFGHVTFRVRLTVYCSPVVLLLCICSPSSCWQRWPNAPGVIVCLHLYCLTHTPAVSYLFAFCFLPLFFVCFCYTCCCCVTTCCGVGGIIFWGGGVSPCLSSITLDSLWGRVPRRQSHRRSWLATLPSVWEPSPSHPILV